MHGTTAYRVSGMGDRNTNDDRYRIPMPA
jgi:hypothetical protein